MKVTAYDVTLAPKRLHPFRRVGRWFKPGETVRVELADLTPAQAEFLAASNPRTELVVTPVGEALSPPAPPVAPEKPAKGKSEGGK